VDKKKPHPKIYDVAAQKLGLEPSECLVVEDSTIGLQAATGAGMRCIITYTPSTKQQVGCAGWALAAPTCWSVSWQSFALNVFHGASTLLLPAS
jgi:beta-phosphoglucomutase-like phosphatase (HAD superfamily)